MHKTETLRVHHTNVSRLLCVLCLMRYGAYFPVFDLNIVSVVFWVLLPRRFHGKLISLICFQVTLKVVILCVIYESARIPPRTSYSQKAHLYWGETVVPYLLARFTGYCAKWDFEQAWKEDGLLSRSWLQCPRHSLISDRFTSCDKWAS
jgi:hypothetical protein